MSSPLAYLKWIYLAIFFLFVYLLILLFSPRARVVLFMFSSTKGSMGLSDAEFSEDFKNRTLKSIKVDTNSQF